MLYIIQNKMVIGTMDLNTLAVTLGTEKGRLNGSLSKCRLHRFLELQSQV